MVVVGAEVVVDGSVELVPAVDSLGAELDSVGPSEEGFSASGLTLDSSDSVVSVLSLASVDSGTEVGLDVPSGGLVVTTVSSVGSEVVVDSGAAVDGEDRSWSFSERVVVSVDCSSTSVEVSGAAEDSEASEVGDDSVTPFSVVTSGTKVVSGAAVPSGELVVWEASAVDPSSSASVVVFETLS